jgi:benzoyl-CoA reductase subunit C
MNGLGKLKEVVESGHEYARRWKAKTGGKVIGYMCTYVPEEIIYAAGMLPVRIVSGEKSSSVGDIHMSPHKWCSFSCGCLAEGLQGKYDYLDGLVIASGCFHNLQAFSSWRQEVDVGYSYYFYMPAHIQGANTESCLVAELREFKQSLESWSGRSISNADLGNAISIYNENRRLMRDIYEFRKKEPPLISGLESMQMVLSSQLMDKAEHNELLKRVAKELTTRDSHLDSGPRLLIVGSGANDLELVGAIESWGASVVIDDHCLGSRYFWSEVEPGEDQLAALARRYIQRPPCPTRDFPERRRLDHLLDLVDTFSVQGAILLLQKYCEPHSYDMPSIEAKLNEINIPSIILEVSPPLAMGQIRNRVETLLEIIRGQAGDY